MECYSDFLGEDRSWILEM
uniref:Uncharacterized protein n=1 Tax=Anguilla anguilla TaxID=7936 RepID=A0A0E9T873_ANGAN